METYNNFISQFEIFDNPPKKKGFHRHHIVPVCEQKKQYRQVIDNRQIYVTKAQHLWCHILYDRENNTRTSDRLLTSSGLRKIAISSYEDCLSFNNVPESRTNTSQSKETRELMSRQRKGKPKSEDWKRHHSESMKGQTHSESHKNNISKSMKGRKWFTNGKESVFTYECPEGYWSGRQYERIKRVI